MSRSMIAVWLVVVSCEGAVIGYQRPAVDEATVSYDEFLDLEEKERESMLARMPPERRIWLKRVHAERWLEEKRTSLTTSQVAVVTEAIRFLSPERYRNHRGPELIKQETEIAHRLACSLGERRALAAFTFRDEEPTRSRSWSDVLDSWAQWLVECVMY